ncbi:uncharacterized protein K489DRAFT_12634 [Dissoconium aciculare CBS 342.82]|uniref:Uncharacterized protein n=1 Tax=Dissoconium aciculare CBS 342.82 TaxID=1314786 RepID=A0A6J3MHY0_9PEZI|nr:uncharacterized protein K489DRAFT_12634 [Dissoconium aciculare CBS 342.82]KAF1827309.1 hypothetical protein K489DRAFT_12634 [Dissoconium aciculare CBS 342.82]
MWSSWGNDLCVRHNLLVTTRTRRKQTLILFLSSLSTCWGEEEKLVLNCGFEGYFLIPVFVLLMSRRLEDLGCLQNLLRKTRQFCPHVSFDVLFYQMPKINHQSHLAVITHV